MARSRQFGTGFHPWISKVFTMRRKSVLRIILIAGLFITFTGMIFAQSWEQGGPWSSNLRWITFNPHDTTQVYGEQRDGGYWISEDGGRTWNNHINEIAGTADRDVRHVLFHPDSPDTMFLYDKSIFRSVDGGITWTEMNSGLEDIEISIVYIPPISPLVVYAGEKSYCQQVRLFRSVDACESWAVIDTIMDMNDITSIRVNPENPNRMVVLARGYPLANPNGSTIRESFDGGSTWHDLIARIHPILQRIARVEIDPDDSLHTIVEAMDIVAYGLYQTVDGGEKWEPIPGLTGALTYHFYDFFADQEWNLYCVRDNGTGRYVLKSTDHGATWIEIEAYFPILTDDIGAYSSAFATNPKNTSSILMANRRGLFHSPDGGRTFTTYGEGLGYSRILKILPASSEDSDLHALNKFSGHWLFSSTSNKWENVNSHFVFDLTEDPSNQGDFYLAGEYIWRWKDNGLIYETLFGYPVTNFIDIEIHPADQSVIYCLAAAAQGLAGSAFFRSEDQGVSWYWHEITGGGILDIAVDIDRPDIVCAATSVGLYLSEDTGITWQQTTSGHSLQKVVVQPETEGIFLLTHWAIPPQEILYSSDGNDVFEDISGGLPDSIYNDIIIRPGTTDHLFVATPSGVYHTLDAGDTWLHFEGPYDPAVSTLAFSENGASIFIGTDSNGIWSGFDQFSSVPESMRNSAIPSNVILYPVYPNPFNASTVIHFQLPEASTVKLQVYSLTGQVIETLTGGDHPVGYHQVVWDAADKSSGTYFIRMEAGDFRAMRKVVLVK